MFLTKGIRNIHHKLLPDDPNIGWIPYLWLVYLVPLFIEWGLRDPIPGFHLPYILGLSVFLYLYFRGYWENGRGSLAVIGCMCLLGTVTMLVSPASFVFFIYASAYCCRVGGPRPGIAVMFGVLAVFLASAFGIGLSLQLKLAGAVFIVIIALINVYYCELARKNIALKLSQEEVRQLAAMAERERIARDLHDLLGHTLSVITLKSELAAKLIERGEARAVHEIREIEKISREALKQVREAVTGYRAQGLAGELANARLAFETAQIAFAYDPPPAPLPSDREAVLAMILREAVTNVLRHSGADRCDIRFRSAQGGRMLETLISDNGRGGKMSGGSGIEGMRRRLAAIGGDLKIIAEKGIRLRVRLPLDTPLKLEPPRGQDSTKVRAGNETPGRLQCQEDGP